VPFPGSPGRYDLRIHGVSETDGPARIEVNVGGVARGQFTFGVAPASSEFEIEDIVLAMGDPIEIVGTFGHGGFARIDRLELTPRE
jgi:hypothetical protein